MSGKWLNNKALFALKKIMSIIFASLVFLTDEVRNVFQYYKECKSIQSLRKKYDSFEKLSSDERKEVRFFYDAKVRQLDGAQKLICRESSIQVVLQLTLISYQENFLIISIFRNYSLFSRV